MNERARWKHRKVLNNVIVGIILLAAALQVYRQCAAWAASYYAVTSYVLVTQNLEHEEVQKIGNWLEKKNEAGAFKSPDYATLHAALIAEFPLVATSVWSRMVPECLTCTIRGAKPLFFVNTHYVAADNGALYKASLFPGITLTLPHVTIGREWLEQKYFAQPYRFFAERPASFLSVYEVAYKNPSMIVVWPKESLDLPHACVCIVDQRTVSLLPDTVALMSLCQGLKEESAHAVDDAVCVFDFRFPERVIRTSVTPKESIQLQRV